MYDKSVSPLPPNKTNKQKSTPFLVQGQAKPGGRPDMTYRALFMVNSATATNYPYNFSYKC
jgi:hypothetical protein